MSSAGKHASREVSADQPLVPEPSFAERAHNLMHLGQSGNLPTHSRKQTGFPLGSVIPSRPLLRTMSTVVYLETKPFVISGVVA